MLHPVIGAVLPCSSALGIPSALLNRSPGMAATAASRPSCVARPLPPHIRTSKPSLKPISSPSCEPFSSQRGLSRSVSTSLAAPTLAQAAQRPRVARQGPGSYASFTVHTPGVSEPRLTLRRAPPPALTLACPAAAHRRVWHQRLNREPVRRGPSVRHHMRPGERLTLGIGPARAPATPCCTVHVPAARACLEPRDAAACL
jgi:hypothetical protein